MKLDVRWLVAGSVVLVCVPAQATVYKCEANGKTVYADAPCTNAKQTEVDVSPSLQGDQQTQASAQARAQDEVRRADAAVEAARKRHDADARRRADVAVADRKAEEARLLKEAAEAERAAAQARDSRKLSKPTKPKTTKPKSVTHPDKDSSVFVGVR